MPWMLDDSFGNAMADAQADAMRVNMSGGFSGEGGVGGGSAWALEVETVSHKGSDSFRRNFTRITNLRIYLKRLGFATDENAVWFKYIAATLELTCGSFLMYAGVVNAYRTMKAAMDAAAAAETTAVAATGPSGWAQIAFAAGIAAGVGAGFALGGWISGGFKGAENVNLNIDWTSPGGRANIPGAMKSNGPVM